jgi:hypothetical protein
MVLIAWGSLLARVTGVTATIQRIAGAAALLCLPVLMAFVAIKNQVPTSEAAFWIIVGIGATSAVVWLVLELSGVGAKPTQGGGHNVKGDHNVVGDRNIVGNDWSDGRNE